MPSYKAKDEIVTLRMVRTPTTSAKAIKVREEFGDEETSVWLPLSEIEVEEIKGMLVEVTMPVWLAKEKRLV